MKIHDSSFFKKTFLVCTLFMVHNSYCMEDYSEEYLGEYSYDDDEFLTPLAGGQTRQSRSHDSIPRSQSKILTLPLPSSSFDTLPEVKKREKGKSRFSLRRLLTHEKPPKPKTIFDSLSEGDTESFSTLLGTQGTQTDAILTTLATELTKHTKNAEEYGKRVGMLGSLLSSLTKPFNLDHTNQDGQSTGTILENSDSEPLQQLAIRLNGFNELLKLHTDVSGHVGIILSSLQLNTSGHAQEKKEEK